MKVDPEDLSTLPGVTPSGLTIPNDCQITQWASMGEKFANMEIALPWLIGDWLLYGEHTYGERFAHYVEKTGKKPGTLMKYRWVAKLVPPEKRDRKIAWSIYAEVAGMTDEERNAALDKVRNEGWTLTHVRAYRKTLTAIKKGKPLPDEPRRCAECGKTPGELRQSFCQKKSTEEVA